MYTYILFRLIVFSRSSLTRLKDSVSCICNRQGNANNTGTAPKARANLIDDNDDRYGDNNNDDDGGDKYDGNGDKNDVI